MLSSALCGSSVFFLSLGHWWVFVIVISHSLCECSSFLKCWVKLILLFCRVISIFPSFLFLSLWLPPPSVCPSAFWFTVYSNTAGCSEPLGMKSRFISDGQLSASSSYRTWGIDTFTWHPQFARLDKVGKTNAWSPAYNNRSEWIQVRETAADTFLKNLVFFEVTSW